MGFNLFPTGGRVMEKAKRIVALALTIAMVFGLCDWAPMGRALAEFTLPHFLLDIGEGAFSGDESLTGVLTTNENLETIGEDAFRGTNFFGAELNGGLKTVGDGALASGSLAYAWVEDAETAVGSGAFADSIYIFGHVSSAVKDWYDDESPSAEFIPIEETKKDATFLYRVVGAGETQEAEVLIPRNGDQEEELVVIPEQIDGVTVTALSENAFHGLDEVSLVVLPENLIPQAEALKDDLAPGAEFITHEYNQESDFQYTVLDKTEKTCRVDAYLGRSQIVDIPPTLGGYQVLSIGRNAFSAWSDYFSGDEWNWRYEHPVLSITLPEGMTKLEDSSLLGAHHVRNVKLPSTLTYIGNNAFGNTRYLRTVALPQGLTRISSYAFSNSGIRTITLPASLEIMGDERGYPQSAFTYCSRLTEILVAPGNQDFSSVDGVLYTKNLERIVCYPAGRRDESFTLPEGVRTIPYGTFSGMRYLKRLGLPVSMDGSLNGIFGSAGGRDACSVSWIEVNSTNGKFSSMDGIVYNKAGTELVLCPPAYAEKKVRLPEGMTKLTERAFSGCVYLEEVVLPSGLREIGDSAFSGCASLRKIDLPGSLTAIGRDAFSYCDSLATLEIPSGVKELPARMAYGCFNLSNVILHEGLTKIGKDTFAQCNLMRLTLPESVTEIGKEAFYGSSNLILRLPSNLKTVSDDGPFCNIRQLEVPASAPALKVSMFKSSAYNSGETEGKPELLILEKGGKSGTFAEKNGYKSVTVSLTGGEAAVLGGTPESGTWSSGWTDIYITIPNEAFGCRVTSIGAGAFQDSELNVTMPDTIRSIGENAFRGAKEQWNTALPKELVSLGENAFRGSGMSSVTIPYRVSAIPAGCFAGLSSFSAHIGAQTEVDGTAFEGVGKLWLYGKTGSPAHDYYLSHSQQQTIYWQNSSVSAEYQSGDWMYTVDETREEATLTGYIGSATEVTVPATIGGYPVSDVDYDIFEENAAIERVTFEAQMEYLPLFKDCVSLREVVLPAGLKSIPSSAFKNCVSLHTLNFPETVEEIRSSAFENSNLEVLPLLPNLKTIGDEAFGSCRSLREIHLPEGLEALCDENYDGGTNKWAFTFGDCTNLHEVVIPDTVTRVGGQMFMNGGVTSIHLGDGIKELPYNFFYYPQNGKLTELELPPNLKSIGEGAVQYNNLSAITIPYGCESIGKQAFESNTELSEAYIPSTVAEIGSDAFGNCSDYLIIYGAVGSEAERYARENGIRFRSSGEVIFAVEPTEITLCVGAGQYVSSIGGEELEPDPITLISEDETIARIEEGTVIGVKPGNTQVRAIDVTGTKEITIPVHVVDFTAEGMPGADQFVYLPIGSVATIPATITGVNTNIGRVTFQVQGYTIDGDVNNRYATKEFSDTSIVSLTETPELLLSGSTAPFNQVGEYLLRIWVSAGDDKPKAAKKMADIIVKTYDPNVISASLFMVPETLMPGVTGSFLIVDTLGGDGNYTYETTLLRKQDNGEYRICVDNEGEVEIYGTGETKSVAVLIDTLGTYIVQVTIRDGANNEKMLFTDEIVVERGKLEFTVSAPYEANADTFDADNMPVISWNTVDKMSYFRVKVVELRYAGTDKVKYIVPLNGTPESEGAVVLEPSFDLSSIGTYVNSQTYRMWVGAYSQSDSMIAQGEYVFTTNPIETFSIRAESANEEDDAIYSNADVVISWDAFTPPASWGREVAYYKANCRDDSAGEGEEKWLEGVSADCEHIDASTTNFTISFAETRAKHSYTAFVAAFTKEGARIGSGRVSFEVNQIPDPYKWDDEIVHAIVMDGKITIESINGTAILEPKVLPENAKNKMLTWTSDNEEVATVVNGVITGNSAGTAKITAKANDRSHQTAECIVTVAPREAESTKASLVWRDVYSEKNVGENRLLIKEDNNGYAYLRIPNDDSVRQEFEFEIAEATEVSFILAHLTPDGPLTDFRVWDKAEGGTSTGRIKEWSSDVKQTDTNKKLIISIPTTTSPGLYYATFTARNGDTGQQAETIFSFAVNRFGEFEMPQDLIDMLESYRKTLTKEETDYTSGYRFTKGFDDTKTVVLKDRNEKEYSVKISISSCNNNEANETHFLGDYQCSGFAKLMVALLNGSETIEKVKEKRIGDNNWGKDVCSVSGASHITGQGYYDSNNIWHSYSTGNYSYTKLTDIDIEIIEDIRPGDAIRYRTGGAHSLLIVEVDDDALAVFEANHDGACGIKWNTRRDPISKYSKDPVEKRHLTASLFCVNRYRFYDDRRVSDECISRSAEQHENEDLKKRAK